jgi:hypothetical protein
MASSATLALNCGLYCWRLLLMNYSYHSWSSSEFNPLSNFWEPLQPSPFLSGSSLLGFCHRQCT